LRMFRSNTMKEHIQFKGYWFRPLDSTNKIAGILHFIPYEKIKLELIGGFDKPRDFLKSLAKDEQKHEDIIWGVDENAKMITLINCNRYGRLNFSSEWILRFDIPTPMYWTEILL